MLCNVVKEYYHSYSYGNTSQRKLRLEYFQNNGKKEGTYKEYSYYGKPLKICNYIDDKLNGEYKEYTDQGELVSERFYIDDEIISFKSYINSLLKYEYHLNDKKYKEYYENGNIKRDIDVMFEYFSFKNLSRQKDKQINISYIKHGIYKEYYGTGTIKIDCNYNQNKLNGPYKKYYSNGNLWIESNYINDKKDGIYKVYQPDGTLHVESEFKDNKKNGIHKLYGSVYEERIYKDNEIVKN